LTRFKNAKRVLVGALRRVVDARDVVEDAHAR
jgi:hypothetical protein